MDLKKLMKDELKSVYIGPQVLIVILLLGFSCWGAIDSFYDYGGQRILGIMPFAAPAVLSGWCVITILWKQITTAEKLVIYFFFYSFIVALPLIIANMLFIIGAWMVPENQAFIEGHEGFHYWWGSSIGGQVMITGLGGVAGQAIGGILAMLFVILPVFSIIKPKILQAGSNLTKIKDEDRRNKITALIYCSLGVVIFITALVIFI